MLPQKIYDAFNAENSTMLAVFFDTSTSSDDTMDAIREIRAITGESLNPDYFLTYLEKKFSALYALT